MLNYTLMIYILALLISLCLIAGQSLWGSAVKQIAPLGSNVGNIELLTRLLQSPRLWIGAMFYVVGTILYFLLLSKVKFFSIQITMTGLAIIMSIAISYFFFNESISVPNMIGIILVLLGIVMVMHG